MDGKLGWSTVYVILHRSEATINLIHLITRNATLKLSDFHMVPALAGGCQMDRSQAKWVHAVSLKVGDGIFTPLECTPIVALHTSEDRGFANPLTFSSYIVVEGTWATTWAMNQGPAGKPGLYANGDVTALWRAAKAVLIELPFQAIYFATRPVYLVFPWPETRIAIDEIVGGLSWWWINIIEDDGRKTFARRLGKAVVGGMAAWIGLFMAARIALGMVRRGLRIAMSGWEAGVAGKVKEE
jgi:hypothetical protein